MSTMIPEYRIPQNKAPKQKSLQVGVTVRPYGKRTGMGADRSRSASIKADVALMRVYAEETEATGFVFPIDEDDWDQELLDLMRRGDPSLGIGPCYCDPFVWFDLYNQARTKTGSYSPQQRAFAEKRRREQEEMAGKENQPS